MEPEFLLSVTMNLPYRIATLCYLFDQDGRVLLLHRHKSPNINLYSPIGGKLEQGDGESPTACALREIHEEADIELTCNDLHLTGIVSERSYEGECHWLMFCYEVTRPVEVTRTHLPEGQLEWFNLDQVMSLRIPETDREIIWPLFLKHRSGFFAVHIDCTDEGMKWTLEQSELSRG